MTRTSREQPRSVWASCNLGYRAGVQLTAEQVGDTGVTADSHTNLQGNILLYDDIAEIDDIADVTEIAEIEIADNPGDRAGVQLTAEQIGDTRVIADSHTNLLGNVLLYDDIAEIEIADMAEVEVPLIPVMAVMPVRREVVSEIRM